METIRKSNTVSQMNEFVNDPFNLWCIANYKYLGGVVWENDKGIVLTSSHLATIYTKQQLNKKRG